MGQYLTGQSSSRRELHREERRRAILDAAKVVFAEKGYDAATLDVIALKAGYAKGTIYLDFPSKEELFLSVIEAEVGKFVDIVREVMARSTRPTEKVGHLVRRVLAHFEENKDFFCIFTPERGGLTERRHPELRSRILSKYQQALSLSSKIIKAGIESGDLRESDPLTLAHLLSGLINGMINKWLMGNCRGSLKRQSDVILSVFLDGVKNPRVRRRSRA